MLVTVGDFRRYMGGLNPLPGQTETIAMILQGVQEQLEKWLNRPVELVQIRENIRSDKQGFLQLSVTPLVKVLSVGNFMDVNTVYPEQDVVEPYVISRDPSLDDDSRIIDKSYRFASNYGREYGGIRVARSCTWHTVEYIGGYNGQDDAALKLSILRVAAREYRKNNVDNVGLNEGITDDVQPGDSRNVGWTKEELTQLERLRRRVYL